MNSSLLLIPLLFGFAGCAVMQARSPATSPVPDEIKPSGSATTSASPTPAAPAVSSPSPPEPLATAPSKAAETSPTETSATEEIREDYASTTPLPSTGKVTIRDHMRNLDSSRLIANCPTDTAPYAFAESTNYQIQICSQEFDPWLPKYYIGHAKDQSGDLRITSSNPDQARQLIFKHDDYTYVIYRDGARIDRQNAYLQIFTPNGNYAEALLYLYEMGAAPQN